MKAPLHRRTEKIGACVADPLAVGEGAEEIDTFAIPKRAQAGVSTRDTFTIPKRVQAAGVST
jgi:hypothetical protein